MRTEQLRSTPVATFLLVTITLAACGTATPPTGSSVVAPTTSSAPAGSVTTITGSDIVPEQLIITGTPSGIDLPSVLAALNGHVDTEKSGTGFTVAVFPGASNDDLARITQQLATSGVIASYNRIYTVPNCNTGPC